MTGRIIHKHITKWQKPFYDGIAHYNGKIHNCKRWRNRRKAEKQWQQAINRYFNRMLARH